MRKRTKKEKEIILDWLEEQQSFLIRAMAMPDVVSKLAGNVAKEHGASRAKAKEFQEDSNGMIKISLGFVNSSIKRINRE